MFSSGYILRTKKSWHHLNRKSEPEAPKIKRQLIGLKDHISAWKNSELIINIPTDYEQPLATHFNQGTTPIIKIKYDEQTQEVIQLDELLGLFQILCKPRNGVK